MKLLYVLITPSFLLLSSNKIMVINNVTNHPYAEHQRRLQFLAINNKATMHIWVQITVGSLNFPRISTQECNFFST